jgi:hypothetical protein
MDVFMDRWMDGCNEDGCVAIQLDHTHRDAAVLVAEARKRAIRED